MGFVVLPNMRQEQSELQDDDAGLGPVRFQLHVLKESSWTLVASSTQHSTALAPPSTRGERVVLPLLQHTVPRHLELLWLLSAAFCSIVGDIGREALGLPVMLAGQCASVALYASLAAWNGLRPPRHWLSAAIFLGLAALSVGELQQVFSRPPTRLGRQSDSDGAKRRYFVASGGHANNPRK